MTHETINNLGSDAVNQLKHLARTNLASAEGFRVAADNIGDPKLTDLFMTVAGERRAFADQLARVLAMNFENTPLHGKVAGMVHRWWIDLRAKFNEDPYSVLAEAERGEDYIKHAYEEALASTGGSSVNDLLQRQYARVKSVHDTVRALRDQARGRRQAG